MAMVCKNCGSEVSDQAVTCQKCGATLTGPASSAATGSNNKVAAGICGILLGALGIHKFILGYTKEGVIMLAVTLLTCGIGGTVIGVIGLIEGIIYLTKSDQEFVRIYVTGRKGWF